MTQQQQSPVIPAVFQAYVYTSFGVLEKELKLRTDVPQSTPLGATQVRIKVHSAALNPADWKLLELGEQFLPTSPTEDAPFRIGFDAAGTVVELGSDVKGDLAVGDAVYTMMPFSDFGAVGEYVAVDIQHVAPKPCNLDFDQAASIPLAGLTSYQALATHSKVQAGERVLVLGGSGGTGIFALQIAKALGAAHVITTTSFRNTEFVKSLGADEVIDYTKEKWVDVLEPHSIDVIYDCGMEPNSWNDDAQKVLKKDTGRFVTINPLVKAIESPIGATLTHMIVETSAQDLKALTKWIENDQIQTVIDSVYPFENLLEALHKVKSERAQGKVVVQVATAAQK